jgi:hypothetical protein
VIFSPRRLGRPEGWPFATLDGRRAADRRTSLAQVAKEPRPAKAINQRTDFDMTATLWHLRQLEIRGQVTHTTDAEGVMRWSLTGYEWEGRPPF